MSQLFGNGIYHQATPIICGHMLVGLPTIGKWVFEAGMDLPSATKSINFLKSLKSSSS